MAHLKRNCITRRFTFRSKQKAPAFPVPRLFTTWQHFGMVILSQKNGNIRFNVYSPPPHRCYSIVHSIRGSHRFLPESRGVPCPTNSPPSDTRDTPGCRVARQDVAGSTAARLAAKHFQNFVVQSSQNASRVYIPLTRGMFHQTLYPRPMRHPICLQHV